MRARIKAREIATRCHCEVRGLKFKTEGYLTRECWAVTNLSTRQPLPRITRLTTFASLFPRFQRLPIPAPPSPNPMHSNRVSNPLGRPCTSFPAPALRAASSTALSLNPSLTFPIPTFSLTVAFSFENTWKSAVTCEWYSAGSSCRMGKPLMRSSGSVSDSDDDGVS